MALLGVLFATLWVVVTQPFIFPADIHLSSKADPSILEQHVRILSETLPGRSYDIRDLAPSRDYLLEQLSRYGDAKLQTFDVKGIQYSNVTLTLGKDARPSIVIGAHYDTYGGLPGADDNASGVAGLLELARLVSESDRQIDVELVAYVLEEPPYFNTDHMGSYQHAASIRGDVELMISLEMIGYFRDEPASQAYPVPWLKHFYSSSGNFIAIVGRLEEISAVRTIKSAFSNAVALPVHSLTFLAVLPGMTFSDHASYWDHGINAVMITDTAFERNPNYHTPDDTADALDYSRMADVVTGTFAALIALQQ